MPKTLYLDTNILIYLLERHETYSESVAKKLDEFTSSSNGVLMTSAITIVEFLAGTDSKSSQLLQKVPHLQFVSLDENLAEQAGLLQRDNKLQIGDAIHLATAIHIGVEAFFTNDKRLGKVASKYVAVHGLE